MLFGLFEKRKLRRGNGSNFKFKFAITDLDYIAGRELGTLHGFVVQERDAFFGQYN